MRLFTLILVSLALSAGAVVEFSGAAIAKDSDMSKSDRKKAEQEAIRGAVARGELLPLPRILAIAKSRVPGEVLKIELEQEDWGLEYEVKILTASGRVREVELDARSGRVVKIEDE